MTQAEFTAVSAKSVAATDPAKPETSTSTVISNDGTPIACERCGSGPALIVVDGALCSRAFGPSQKLATLLARDGLASVADAVGADL